ncbi:uncharacterized protein LOC133846936 [Drosophila sulfurigaster albostrigata]|uniref:uncharacterized protein LOC133846936 n=1 Tax=Drosophila sulfurigaster albostrigata TaxID=89887 RepID=UPI002D21CE25|nr:uncharacterized protein LOC133846936 [Drosophila sulfurigaster albostrigata]
MICAHAPTEQKDDAAKDAFYARLEDTYDRCPNHDVKIILGDFNAKVGRERIFDRTVGQFSLHETTSNNGFRLIDFAAARNMVPRYACGYAERKTYAPSRNESLTTLGCDHNGQQQPTPLTSRNCSTNLPLFLLTPSDSGRTYPTPCELPLKQPLVKRLTQGFKTGASNCRDENGNLVTDTQCTLRLWRAHFSKLLAEDDGTNPAIGGSSPIPPIDDNVDIPLPSHDEVRVAIMRLKNNKAAGADGLPTELFKAGDEELIRCMHQLFCKIWLEESMPNDWNLSVLCPVLKKGDPTISTNYRGISLIAISYKVLSSVICERLKPYTSTLIGPYQCGFRPGKSTIDQIFTLRQILEKTHENGIDTHHLFHGVFERKILRKIFGPVRIGDDFRIRMNHELYELYDDVDVVRRITIQRLRWLRHVVRMEARVDYGRRRRGRPNLRWKDQVEQDLNLLGISNWRRRAKSRGA